MICSFYKDLDVENIVTMETVCNELSGYTKKDVEELEGLELGSAWSRISVKGLPSECIVVYHRIMELVDEIDECVARFHLSPEKMSMILGKQKMTIKSISSITNVRINIPVSTQTVTESKSPCDNKSTNRNININDTNNTESSTTNNNLTKGEKEIEDFKDNLIELEGEVPDVFEAIEIFASTIFDDGPPLSKSFGRTSYRRSGNESKRDRRPRKN